MTKSRSVSHLPLRLTGVPLQVTEWLRAAGLPVEEISGVGVTGGGGSESTFSGPILFDSRTPSSRFNAETARSQGIPTIDVAELLSRRARSSADAEPFSCADPLIMNRPAENRRRQFLEQLRSRIESHGGLWARISDYPFPDQGVLCRGGNDFAGEGMNGFLLPVSAAFSGGEDWETRGETDSGDAIGAWLDRAYQSGRPIWVSDSVADPMKRLIKTVLNSDRFPLLWKTTVSEFVEWRRLRRGILVSVQQEGAILRIESRWQHAGLQPALELWHGNHYANIPLSVGRMEVDVSGVAFRRAGGRHAAGLTVFSEETGSSRPIESASVI
ncbi:MAG: hypothetical protein IID45_01220 [Planctomycetes bacterium]|nr:hypothetical protein [Planctomycetota bacterium]